MIHVCPLNRLAETVAETGARHVVTVINAGTPVTRPAAVPETQHLYIGMNDITAPQPGLIAPGEAHVATLVEFVRRWPRETPLVVHCWAGISRSPAAAYIAALALDPTLDELTLARELRRSAPSATPNILLVRVADRLLGRGGRMVAAIESIGRGAEAGEGTPFMLPLRFEA